MTVIEFAKMRIEECEKNIDKFIADLNYWKAYLDGAESQKREITENVEIFW